MVTILYFAWLRDRLGRSQDSLSLPAGATPTVRAVMDELGRRDAAFAAVFGGEAGPIRCAVNQEFADPDQTVRAGDELAFFPPVTGG